MWLFLGNVVFQKIPTIMQDLSRRSIATSGESVSMYPRRPKAEASSDAVDVVEGLHDPTDPSTERTAPPRSAHVQLNDVSQTLDPVERRGRVSSARRCGDGDDEATGAGASPKHCNGMTEMCFCGGGHRTRLEQCYLCVFGCPPAPIYKGARRRCG